MTFAGGCFNVLAVMVWRKTRTANVASMIRKWTPTSRVTASFPMLVLLFCAALTVDSFAADSLELTYQTWFEARTAHFRAYSCGATQAVAKLAARLEQFHLAYSSLAGTQAVASPPIIVLALPERLALQQFVPLYHGNPTSLSGFFHRASDENLIVLSLANESSGLDTIFH